jgi:hypothetical protein
MTIPLPRRLRRSAALAAMAVVLPLVGAGASQAAYVDFDCRLASGATCSDNRYAVRSVSAYTSADRSVGAGASTTSTSAGLVSALGYGTRYTCSYFDGSRLLYPLVFNASGVTLMVGGTAEFGSQVVGC